MSGPLTPPQAAEKIPFLNADVVDVPPCAVMRVTASIVEDGVTILACARVDTVFTTEYAINGLARVRPGDKGVCYRRGDLQVAYDDGSPFAGEGWGVRANQWTLSRGYPAIATVHSVRDAANKILHAAIAAPRSVMGVCESDLNSLAFGVPGSAVVAVYAWNDTQFVPADPAMYFIGTNASLEPIKAGTLAQFVEADGLWIVVAAAGGDKTAIVKPDGEAADEATCLWPGRLVALDAETTSACDNPFEETADCWLMVLNASGGSWSDSPTTLSTDEYYLGKYVFSVGDVPVYAIRVDGAGGGTKLYWAQLSGTLSRADASGSIMNVQSLDGQDPPTVTTVSNLLHLAGLNGDDCFIVEDTSSEEPVYYFLNIEHHDCP